jgi:chromosome partitioning protein
MASIVAVLGTKGGAGKSTISTNLARGLQESGSVCIVDADPQGTALRWDNAQPDNADLPGVFAPSMPLDERIPDLGRGWDYVVVDGAAKAKDRTRQSVEASDVVLIPVRPSGADIWASEWLVGVIRNRQRMTGGKPQAAFVVSQQVVGTNLAGEIGEVLEGYDLPLLDGRTSQRVAYAEALSVGTTVLDMDPNSKASAEVRQITQETLQLINTTETTHA